MGICERAVLGLKFGAVTGCAEVAADFRDTQQPKSPDQRESNENSSDSFHVSRCEEGRRRITDPRRDWFFHLRARYCRVPPGNASHNSDNGCGVHRLVVGGS